MNRQPFISIIIPVYNGSKYLNRCLEAIMASSYRLYEIIVVDDGSTDDSDDIARKKGARVFQLERQSGPAAARNYGAKQAQGDILFFVDSDVLVQKGTIERVAKNFMENPDIAALFGSYDDNPSEKNFLSQYKNLFHHYVHQQSSSEAVTFWAGCGAVRRNVFEKVGGFDQNRYRRPEIEDIELGYRMRRMGCQILLDKMLQVKHLKQWRLGSLLRADIFCRAIPWSKLILESRGMVNDLNLRTSDRISTGLVGLSVGIIPFSALEPQLLYAILIFVAVIFILNYRLYGFFLNRKGLKFTALAFPLHLLYYIYSGASFVLCWGKHILFPERKQS